MINTKSIKNIILLVFIFVYSESISQSGEHFIEKIDLLLSDSKFEEAIDIMDQHNIFNEETEIILANKKAEALISLGRFNEAEALLTSTYSKSQRAQKANLLMAITKCYIGFLYLNQGRNVLALEILLEASKELQFTNNDLRTAQALTFLGLVYNSTGKYSKAEQEFQMALTLRQRKLDKSNELIAASYNDLGLVYSQLDPIKAISYYDSAMSIYENNHGQDHPKIAIINTNLGVAYLSIELFGDAINYFEKALSIWEKLYPRPHPSKALVLINLGRTYSAMKNSNFALQYYEKAINMQIISLGQKHPDIAYSYNLIGNIFLSQNKFAEALKNYQKALIANSYEFNKESIYLNPKGSDFYNGNTLLYSLEFKAQALEAQYFGKTLKLSNLQLALNTLQVADTLIDKLRQQSTSEADKLALGQIANDVYADGVRIAYEASVGSVKKKEFKTQAFYFAEKSKSSVLLEAIAESDAKSFAGIPNDLLDQEQKIKSGIALTAQKLAQKPNPQEEKKLREIAYQLNRDYDAFTKQLETKFPEYFNLKYNTTSPTISELQQKLDNKTCILSYFINSDDNNNTIYIFKLTKRKFEIVTHVLSKDFDRYISGLRNGLYFNDPKTYKLSATQLSRLLIPKLPGSITSLIIVPTGRLSIVPFETLFTKTPKDEGYQSLPYVLNRFNTRYEFSARLILQKSNKTDITSPPSIFLCAPIVFPEKDHLNELPGSESEVKKIDSLFKAKQFRTSLFTNTDASEMLIKSGSLKNFKLLHFATHGIVDEKNAELSRIFLQTTSNTEDGNLFAGEIYNLSLQADLVTLSACQTGLGKISKGEGVIGLSRALVYAGAKNIIVSFWSVADQSTSDLMQNFYSNMLNTSAHDYSENLRQAKIKLIKESKYAAPYYWAPFILIGY